MEQKTQSPKMLRQRKFLLVLPMLVLPFLTLMFWSLGGGKVENTDAQPLTNKGFNMKLPDANLRDDKPLDKMSYYDKAAANSAKLGELMRNDPNYKKYNSMNVEIDGIPTEDVPVSKNYTGKSTLMTSPYGNGISRDSNEVKVYRKLAELDKAMKGVAVPNMEPVGDAPRNQSENKIGRAHV